MEKTLLKQLLVAAARKDGSVNFADAQSAAKNALVEYFGIESISIREIKKHEGAIFAIIEEVVEQVLPAELESRVGQFAEIKSFARDEQVKFTLKGVGRQRVMRGIVKGARGGIYRARRLDDKDMILPTSVYTVGYQITLEELLTGRRTVAELVELIAMGFVEIIYAEVIKALRVAGAAAPAANKHLTNTFSETAVKKVIRTISAYGSPVIIAFESAAELFANTAGAVAAYNPNLAAQDLDEIRNNGRVSIYHGTPIMVLPNYFMDETNAQWMFKENQIFVLPVNEKPVKVAMQGDLYTAEVQQPHGGVEYHAHRMMGVGVLFNNNIGLLDIAADDGGIY